MAETLYGDPIIMARTPNKTSFGEYKLVNVYFNDRERVEYEKWFADLDQVQLTDLHLVVEGGFKVSQSYDDHNESYVVALTGKKPFNKALKSMVFVIRHADYHKACLLATYFYAVILAGGEQLPKSMSSELDW